MRVRFYTPGGNKFDLVDGVLKIPSMTINSTLGFIELSGSHDRNMNMEYYVRVPWTLVTHAAASKLFARKETDPLAEDEIQFRDENKRYGFINLKITGTPETYKVSLERDKNSVQ